MFSKSNLIGTIVAAVWGFFGGGLLWGNLMDATLQEHVVTAGLIKAEPDMVHLIIGCIVVAFCLANIYGKWANGNYSIGSGLSFGVWIGVFTGLGLGLVNMATLNFMDIAGTFIDAGINIVFLGIMGLLIGLVYSKTSSTAA